MHSAHRSGVWFACLVGDATAEARKGLSTPQQLAAISRRNADKLQLLSSMDMGRGRAGPSAEALDSFLAKFVGATTGVSGRNFFEVCGV